MIPSFKILVTVSALAIGSGSALFAQSDLIKEDFQTLSAAFEMIATDEDKAQEMYQGLIASTKTSDAIKRAATEGEAYVLVRKLEQVLVEAKTKSVLRALSRNRRAATVDYLEDALAKYNTGTLQFLLAKTNVLGTDKTPRFDDMPMAEEYARLKPMPDGFELAKPAPKVVEKPAETASTAVPASPAKPVAKTATVVKLPNTTYYAKKNTNIRKGPSTQSAITGQVKQGSKIIAIERHSIARGGKWLRIKGGKGYVTAANFGFEAFPAVAKPTAVVKPKTVVPAPRKPAPKPAKSVGNSKCNKQALAVRFKTTGPTKVYRDTKGTVRFSWGAGNTIKSIVGSTSGYWIIRLGSPAPNVPCGYIKQNSPTLKQIN
ncbi:hypothetical protein GCM10007939_22310 [Amylibacter marinus]|uniref:SH3b domain-containing protein n=1 Tax=Amylibacter marinus TaxID=1475483 RepID=A0ABQ5VXC8_9RHOB|nr:SH3 domain-containing protein [Amylibacter marinus]GLQ35947.1 hypothetical protein GCM10007939_22310 [Amylibacter marinus]